MDDKMRSFRFMVLVIFVVLTGTKSEDEDSTKAPTKRSYVCPPNFIRLSNKCYFFSKKMATWQDAYWRCRDLHSNLAIIRNAHQDKLIRRTLNKDSLVPLERWLGGMYDWAQMSWKWAASAKTVTYSGFPENSTQEDKEKLRWHCIVVDPTLQYRWNSRSCFEKKHFICHTKIKVVSNKENKKLQKQYNADNVNKLNEIPVPDLPEDNYRNATNLKGKNPNEIHYEGEQDNELYAQFAKRPRDQKRRRKGRGRRRKLQLAQSRNGTVIYEVPQVKQGKHRNNRRRRNKSKESKENKDASIENIKWKTYYSQVTISPIHPRRIVEEFSYSKK